LLQFRFAEVPQALLVKIRERGIDLLEHRLGFGRQVDMDDPAIFFAAGSGDEAIFLKPVEQARHRRHDLDHALADFIAPHRATFAPEDAEHVVLGTRQAEFSKELSKAVLELVARASDVEHRLLLGRLERLLFSEFVVEGFCGHGVNVGQPGIRMEVRILFACNRRKSSLFSVA